jgi:hypothetical protein
MALEYCPKCKQHYGVLYCDLCPRCHTMEERDAHVRRCITLQLAISAGRAVLFLLAILVGHVKVGLP